MLRLRLLLLLGMLTAALAAPEASAGAKIITVKKSKRHRSSTHAVRSPSRHRRSHHRRLRG
jgi:hypothetical protein